MKIILFKIAKYITEENRFGSRTWYELPSHILTTAAYLAGKGLAITVRNYFPDENPDFSGYDIAVEWVSIADGLYEGLFFLSLAKKAGLTTALMLFDDWQGMQKEIMEDYGSVDFAVHGYDREIVLEKLLSCLQQKKTAAGIPGLVYRAGNEVIDSGLCSAETPDLGHLVSSREWIERLNPQKYTQYFFRASTGCPFCCTFCHIGKRKPRFRPAGALVDELAAVPPGSYVRIGSADMLSDPAWTERFAQLLLRENVSVRWETDARADMVKDEKLLRLMRDAGCAEIAIGIESFHPAIIDAIRKNIKLDAVYAGVDTLLRCGITPALNMMLGHPLDSDQTLTVTYDALSELLKKGAKLIGFQFLRPLPGTAIEAECLAEGLLAKRLSYKEWFQSRSEPLLPTRYLSCDRLMAWMARMSTACLPGKTPGADTRRSRPLQALRSLCRQVNAGIQKPGGRAATQQEKKSRNVLREVISINPHNVSIYKYMLQDLKNDADVVFITSVEFFSGAYDPAALNILLRHDIDFRPKKLPLLIEQEISRGIHSDIYVIFDPALYDVAPHRDYLRSLRDRGFVVGLHTLAPGNDDWYSVFCSELEQFRKILGFPAEYVTIHGKSPHPPRWPAARQAFIEGIKDKMAIFGLKGSHNIVGPDHWVEDTGVGLGEFSVVRKEFLRIREIRKAGVIGVLTHPIHWAEADVAWPVTEEASKAFLKTILDDRG